MSIDATSGSATLVADLDSLFARWNRADQPGLIVGVRQEGRCLYRRAFGMASLETSVANSIATRMRIGSTTKHMLALLALLLHDDGQFDLDRPIGAYLPALRGVNAEPTSRQLLQHRGGTRCHIDLGFIGHGMSAAPVGSAFETIAAQTGRNFAPGEATIYNNGGYHLVSRALERVAGAPLETLLRARFFDPLGMYSTALVPSDYVMTQGIASLHLPPNGAGWRRGLFPSSEVLGEGGVVSTIDDMLLWAAHLRAHSLWSRLLDLPQDADGTCSYYGLGLMTRVDRGVRTFRHPGGVLGGACEMLSAPDEKLDIVILSNGAPDASPMLLADQVLDLALAREPARAAPGAKALEPWLGDYAARDDGMVYSLEAASGAPCLRIAKYPIPFALALEDGGWLSTGLTGVGTMRVRCDLPHMLHLQFAGRTNTLERLRAAPSRLRPGRFAGVDSGLTAAIELQGERGALRMWDRWGAAAFELLPLGAGWFQMRSTPDPMQFSATIWFADGCDGDFVLNSARTRNLRFERS